VDVLAVHRGDEGLVELVEDLVGVAIAHVLGIGELGEAARYVPVVLDEIAQQPRAGEDVLGGGLQEIEEAFLAGNQSKQRWLLAVGLVWRSSGPDLRKMTSPRLVIAFDDEILATSRARKGRYGGGC